MAKGGIDRKDFEAMRQELERFDGLREQVIGKSRQILKLSKAAIYAMHRDELKDAESKLAAAKKLIAELEFMIKKDPELDSVGAYSEALQERVEALCYFGFLSERKLITRKQAGCDAITYLEGVCDLVGELTRKAVNSAIDGEGAVALEIRDFVKEVYDELMLFDFRNIPVRKKFDSIKYSLERLENLALQLKSPCRA